MPHRSGSGHPLVLRSGLATAAVAGSLLLACPTAATAATVTPSPAPPEASASPETTVTPDDAAVAHAEATPEPTAEPAPTATTEEPAPEPATDPDPAPTTDAGGGKASGGSAGGTSGGTTTSPEPDATTAPADDAPDTGSGGSTGTTTPSPSPAAPESTPYDPDAPASAGVPGPEALEPVTFDDVSDLLGDPTYSVFAGPIAWMGRAGIADGVLTEAGRAYQPEATLTRGEFAAFLYRLAGSPARIVPKASPFADAGRRDTDHAAEIAWLAAQGIVTGRLDGTARAFRPDDPLTRGAMARWLYRFAGAPDVKAKDRGVYADVVAGSETDDAASWLAETVGELGSEGPDGLELHPGATLSRGAIAAILQLAHRADVGFVSWAAPLRLVDPTVVQVDVDSALNLRAGPSTNAAIAMQREDGASLETTGAVTSDGWVEVVVGDRLLWASPGYLAVDGTGGSTATGGAAGGVGTTAPALAAEYENGRIPASALCGLPWHEDLLLACGAADDLTRLDAAFHDLFGLHIPVSSAYRDYAGQLAATARYGGMAAVPGTSNHGWGEAIDLSEPGLPGGYDGEAYAWLVSAAPQYGWTLPGWAQPGGSKPEPWHLEHLG
ncbi:D-alanyl-D-alanine carboxypeptidase family protein [Demequina maris]|uniref:D-alanyl-D-alanine carboxypeptidase family protein n=1 Tax=Demequina maris TaxID=1638982 RepID=UPI000780F296|nr:D-alanyl-D-alanine carboxypeptidase family protein [Demequina maris]